MMNEPDETDCAIESRLCEFSLAIKQQGSLADAVLERLNVTADPSLSLASQESQAWGQSYRVVSRFLIGGALAGMFAVAVFTLLTPRTLLAEVAQNIQQAKTYTVQLKAMMKNAETDQMEVMEASKWFWRAPNDFRIETDRQVKIVFRDKPGISWSVQNKTYWDEPAQQGYQSPLMMLPQLGRFAADAKDLGKQEIAGVQCTGFSIEMKLIESSVGDGDMAVWIDEETKLPMRVSFPSNDWNGEMVFEDFSWNVALDKSLFETEPPAEFARKAKRAKRSTDEMVEKIVLALKSFRELSGGYYPQVKVIYGDVTRDKMYEIAGYQKGDERSFLQEDNYVRIMQSSAGFARMNMLMRVNPDCLYHGLTVTPEDKDQVLFRWKLDDGQYQVIYGDLSTKRVSKFQLPE